MPRRKPRRYYHYGIYSLYGQPKENFQVGCTTGVDKADAQSNLEDKEDWVGRLAKKDCNTCREFEDE